MALLKLCVAFSKSIYIPLILHFRYDADTVKDKVSWTALAYCV